jgi:hypothetical protein
MCFHSFSSDKLNDLLPNNANIAMVCIRRVKNRFIMYLQNLQDVNTITLKNVQEYYTNLIKIFGIGINTVSEILHSKNNDEFAVMNKRSTACLRHFKNLDYTKKSKPDFNEYQRFCLDCRKILDELNLNNFTEFDTLLNYTADSLNIK